MDDVRAVMDAAGSKRAALFGISEGAPMSLLFAATYPERARAFAWSCPWTIKPVVGHRKRTDFAVPGQCRWVSMLGLR
jgi:pimeloyl-ACP methyl ester carboxylesterase